MSLPEAWAPPPCLLVTCDDQEDSGCSAREVSAGAGAPLTRLHLLMGLHHQEGVFLALGLAGLRAAGASTA